jgi:GT2 family glycosyltransferase
VALIPALIVPTLNQDFEPLLVSIDHEIDQIVIIDNGDRAFEDWVEDTYQTIHLPHNIGVAASWNLGIKATPHADWWLICNDDITFGEGDLGRLVEAVDPAIPAMYFMLGMAAFAVTPALIDEIGWFDEGFINAYDEDLDFARRCRLAGYEPIEVGFTGTHIGSATIYSDPELREWNHRSHMANDGYYALKWGGYKQGGEKYDVPFDGHPQNREPRMARLRAQSWPRPSTSPSPDE